MALTIRKDPDAIKLPGLTVRSYEIDFDNSYPTGGEAWDLSADFSVIKGAVLESEDGYVFKLTSKDAPASATVIAYQGDNANAAAGPLVQVANATDLSAVTKVGVLVWGKKS